MDTAECIRYASVVASLKCAVPGGRAGIPDRDTVIEAVNNYTWV
jgi:sugar/nucleoside kinase (ribokinase family)